MTTIKDIASRVGVSITAVSQVLNNKEVGIKKETKEKILETARELDYKPNYLARGLITKRTKTIGLIIPDITNPFFPQIVRAIEDTANKMGYNMILCNTDDNLDKEQLYLDILKEKCVDGIIFTSSTESTLKHEDLLSKIKSPLVLLDRGITGDIRIPKVYTHGYNGLLLGVNYLVEKDHKKIGFISGPETSVTAKERLKGYRSSVEENGLETKSEWIYYGDYKVETGEKAVKELLNRDPEITAIISANDLMAVGAMREIKNHGLRVPEDISVIGFDNIQISRFVDPALTTIAQPSYRMGELATELLINQIEDKEIPKKEHELEPKLIVRDSVTFRR
ncbi:LacI family DNA-binding transcriptional regulator [Natranaerobius trueperi]|uniref:LacI family transcriptional regulator n=1 Tax=Natranaerobius trueperi TaxID=759412 RepID=A0A226BVF8_9FIRM|nr:LacI family DNA-binding transcriptional regulator [Natranaerobius trueperi]OWZ83028.1 LacI family transcriptional regulator [Natranaerobius trueperi]